MNNFDKIEKVVKLLLAKREKELTVKEQEILDNWLEEDEGNKVFADSLSDESKIPVKMNLLSNFNKDEAFLKFKTDAQKAKTRKLYLELFKYAAIVIPFVFVTWFMFQKYNFYEPETQLVQTEIQPGTSKAILKLADGSVIDLEKEKDLIADLDGTVVQNSTKEISYNSTSKKIKARKIQYNEIEIPRGGEYQLTLSDGTKVWLNSETSIKYPVTFASNKREIYLQSGEAFFEVTKNKSRPFIVHTAKMDVNVLGTSFNVRAYTDEKELTTTLITGKVSIKQSESNKAFSLLPNDQALLSDAGMDIKSVDVSKFIAWKNGRILFEDNTLDEMFKDLSRWYDIDVDFENKAKRNLRFSVDVERYDDLSEVLEILELTEKVKFNIVENTITIM